MSRLIGLAAAAVIVGALVGMAAGAPLWFTIPLALFGMFVWSPFILWLIGAL